MAANLTLARPDDLDALLVMLASCAAERGIDSDDDDRRAALLPLLEGSPLGAVYLVGPKRAPVGFIVVTFGWSIEMGGMDAFVDEFWIRSGVRGRGMGSEVLAALLPRLEGAGVRAIHLEVERGNARLLRLYAQHRFQLRDGYHLMTRRLRR